MYAYHSYEKARNYKDFHKRAYIYAQLNAYINMANMGNFDTKLFPEKMRCI